MVMGSNVPLLDFKDITGLCSQLGYVHLMFGCCFLSIHFVFFGLDLDFSNWLKDFV